MELSQLITAVARVSAGRHILLFLLRTTQAVSVHIAVICSGDGSFGARRFLNDISAGRFLSVGERRGLGWVYDMALAGIPRYSDESRLLQA